MSNVFSFGDPIVITHPSIRGTFVAGPFKIKAGTSMSKNLQGGETFPVDQESLRRCVEETVWDPQIQSVVFYDDLEDLASFYKAEDTAYTAADPIRVSGLLKEINLDEMTFVVEVEPKAIFKPASTDGVSYNLYPRGNVEWDGSKIKYTKIYCYDLAAIKSGGQ